MTDHAKTIRDALIALFNADDDVKEGGSLGVINWYKRVEDGLVNRRPPFGYVEFQRRIHDPSSDDIDNVGYFYEYEIGVLTRSKSRQTFKADDNATTLMDKIEDILLENRTVSDNVDDLAVPIEWEFVRGRIDEVAGDISWGVLRVMFKKGIVARQ